MVHFKEQPWVDFVRGVGGSTISRDIRTHLSAGCLECKTSHDDWSRVRRLATEETAYEPPENQVRLVKLGFRTEPAQELQKWTLADLVFDSFAQPLLYGVRSGAVNVGPGNAGGAGVGGVRVWQVVHEAEGLTVDLRFSHRTHSQAVQLVGQVFDKQAVRPLPSSAIIELSADKDRVIASAVVSVLGEFKIEFEATDRILLSVKATGRNTVRISLPDLRLR
jgi:hypothetical protein